MSRIADNNELAAAFDEVKTTAADFADKGSTTDFTFDILDGAPDDAACSRGFGVKDPRAPAWVCVQMSDGCCMDNLHASLSVVMVKNCLRQQQFCVERIKKDAGPVIGVFFSEDGANLHVKVGIVLGEGPD